MNTFDWCLFRVKYTIAYRGTSPVLRETLFIIGIEIDDVLNDMNAYFAEIGAEEDSFEYATVDSIKLIQSGLFVTKEAVSIAMSKGTL